MAEGTEEKTLVQTEETANDEGASAAISATSKAEIDKAEELLVQAEKKVQSGSGWLGKIMGGSSKFEDATELYSRAANKFKIAKAFERSGDAFVEAAKIHAEKLDSRHEAANCYAEAAQVYKKAVPRRAIECYQMSVEIYSDMVCIHS
jgi:alpha-soluble NSF attachment protein